MGFMILLATICLNTVGLIWLRGYSTTPDMGLMVLALGYLPMAAGIFIYRHTPLKAVAAGDHNTEKFFEDSVSHWKWVVAWSAGLSAIYALFFKFPQFLPVSQLIVAQSVTPLLAVVLTGDYFSAQGRREPLQRLFPMVLLLILAAIKSRGGFGEVLSFAGVCGAFLLVQSSMRHLSRLQRPQWVLPRFALMNFALISTLVLFLAPPVKMPSAELFYFGAAAGVALLLIQGGYLVGIARTPPLLSALVISASVPLAVILEWVYARQTPNPAEAFLALGYVGAVAAQAFLTQKSVPAKSAAAETKTEKEAA